MSHHQNKVLYSMPPTCPSTFFFLSKWPQPSAQVLSLKPEIFLDYVFPPPARPAFSASPCIRGHLSYSTSWRFPYEWFPPTSSEM